MATSGNMSTFDDLVASQKDTGDLIETIISNFKKDPVSRKTSSYYKERITRLDVAWAAFETTDNKIRCLENAPLDHSYFTSNYYSKMSELTLKYKEILETSMMQASNVPQPKEHQPSERVTELNESSGLARLIRKQRAIISSLQRLMSALTKKDDSHPPQFFKVNLFQLNKLWDEIEAINYQIWELCEDPIENGYNFEEYQALEESVQSLRIKLTVEPNQGETNVRGQESVKMPEVKIPQFDGDYLTWKQFHDLFEEMIHKSTISKVQKMWYLKSCLTGEPEKLIRHLPLCSENYDTAWQSLQDRYDNMRVLTSTLLQKIFSQPKQASDAPTANHIKSLHDITKESLLALQNLGVNISSWDPILLHFLLKKLDKQTYMLYEQGLKNPKELQNLGEFLKFLEIRFQSLEAMGQKEKSSSRACATAASSNQPENTCPLCKNGSHPLYRCHSFQQLTPPERLNFIQRQRLCVNCLKSGHAAKICTSRSCTKCNKRHNSLLHLESAKFPLKQSSSNGSNNGKTFKGKSSAATALSTRGKREIASLSTYSPDELEAASLTTAKTESSTSYVILSSAIVKIIGNNGQAVECRAVLDSGSQVNLLTERVARRLGLSLQSTSMMIEGIGSGRRESRRRVNVKLQSRTSTYSTRLEAFILPNIVSQQPAQQLDISNWELPKNIVLADPRFNYPGDVDVLIGAEFFYNMLRKGQIHFKNGPLTLQNTVFGWVVGGKINNGHHIQAVCGIFSEKVKLDQDIERFWQLETIESSSEELTTAEKLCESHFALNTTRTPDGRFSVKIPFAEHTSALGDSKQMAINRFYSLERRLARDSTLKAQYTEFMNEYESLGHMTKIDIENICSPCYFIPHHCVMRPESSTTKLRVVFDASAKTSSGIALNDLMHTGPTIQKELFSVLLRFRCPRFVFTSDIQKMYRQILVHEEDRRYQLIVWRKEPNRKLNFYQLNTVTYGTRSAPYLATKCLQQLAKDYSAQYPLAAAALMNDFYVDDCLTGSDSLIGAVETQQELSKILLKGGFRLRKWCANHPKLLQSISAEDHEVDLDFNDDENKSVKTLGLTWLPKSDDFCIRVTLNEANSVTKRTVVSDVARIFDPLGILAPVVVVAKIIIQKLWLTKMSWDEQLPTELNKEWIKFRNSLTELDNTHVPRHIFQQGARNSLQLHAFVDASEKAYGAAIYARSICNNGTIIVRLLCAKSRVAPLKTQTIPRLELCAALLGAQLMARVKEELKTPDVPTYFWTDSQVVLSWINSPSRSFQTFVANRVARIQELCVDNQWRHVRLAENPADVLSRGISPSEFSKCHLWFYGPFFLHGHMNGWPVAYSKELEIETTLEKKRVATLAVTASDKEDHLIYKIPHKNSFTSLVHIMSYLLRFITNARTKEENRIKHSFLTPEEQGKATSIIIRAIQQSHFKEEFTALKNNRILSKTSQLRNLNPFLDDQEIIRVGGRLQSSTISYDAKHPRIIPYNDPISKLIAEWLHKEHLHCGPQTLLAHLRQQFWPIKGKSLARSVVQHCVRCSRAKPKLFQQIMGGLPEHRVQKSRPFINSGVDFCGPFWVHFKMRGRRPHKAYVAVFCCFATKAIHLEVVSDLTTEAFIGCLKRFVGRRGRCQNIYCDNATNFVGANNQLQDLKDVIYSKKAQDLISKTYADRGIKFNFIPPRAPHFGGLWEAAVKSAKNLFYRTASTASLTYEELETVMVGIESILNSRPLTPMSSDPNDLSALTPGHFLIGEPLTAPVDTTAAPNNTSLLTRWRLVSHLKNEFWKRWSREYLNELQYRHKWKEQANNVEIGTMVIVKEDNLPSLEWPLGRIIKVIRGADGLVRVVDVRTATGIFRRPIHKLAPLHATADQEDSLMPSAPTTFPHHDRPDDNDVHKSKRKRVSYNSALTAVLLTCLCLSFAAPAPIEIQPFTSNPGIYFEKLGPAGVINSEWNIVTHIDMQSYWKQLKIIQNYPQHLQHLCAEDQSTHCSIIPMLIKRLVDDITVRNQFLTPHQDTRFKRGAMNFVGNIANSLFGVLDSEYAKEAADTINKIRQNENYLLHRLNNQTSFLDSTINIMKKSEGEFESEFNKVEQALINLGLKLKNMQEEINKQVIMETTVELTLQATLELLYLQRIQDSLLDILTDTNHGKISTELISPKQLQYELINIRANLPKQLRLPTEDLLHLYNLMTIEGRILASSIIFRLRIPLISTEDFELLQLTPVPWMMNDSFIKIQSSIRFLIINLHRDWYYPLKETELTECILTKEERYLCQQGHPLFKRGSNTAVCELNLLNQVTTNTSCTTIHTGNGPHWLQLHHPNTWIYAVSSDVIINAVCEANLTQMTLRKSGLLTLNENCIIKQPLVTIQGHRTLQSTHHKAYIPAIESSDMISSPAVHSSFSNLSVYNNSNIKQLTAIQQELSNLRIDLPNDIRPHDIHHYSVGYACLIGIICIICWLVLRQIRKHRQAVISAPQPKPRNHAPQRPQQAAQHATETIHMKQSWVPLDQQSHQLSNQHQHTVHIDVDNLPSHTSSMPVDPSSRKISFRAPIEDESDGCCD